MAPKRIREEREDKKELLDCGEMGGGEVERRERSLMGKRRCGIEDIVIGLWMGGGKRDEGLEGKDWERASR